MLKIWSFASLTVAASLVVLAEPAFATLVQNSIEQRFAAEGIRDAGRANPAQRIELTVTLKHRHAAELASLVAAQSDPKSPLRGRYLTPSQFDAYFGATPATRAAVAKTFAAAGMVRDLAPTTASIERFSGTVAAANKLFSTDIHTLAVPARGTRFASVLPVRVPATIAPAVVSVSGLDNLDNRTYGTDATRAPQSVIAARPTTTRSAASAASFGGRKCSPPAKPNTVDLDQPQIAANGNPGFGPATFEADFNLPIERGCGGAGVTVGIFGNALPLDSDIAGFFSYFNVARTLPAYILRPTGTPGTLGDQGEATLDIDTVASLAPDANVVFYDATSDAFSDIINAMNDVAQDNIVDVFNVSFLACEGQDAADTEATDAIAEQLAAQGITITVSSGDTGYDMCFFSPGIGAPGSSSYVTNVGGVGPAGSQAYRTVTGWSGSSGGPSAFIARPYYQRGIAACKGAFRCTPDIALASGLGTFPIAATAIDGAYIILDGSAQAFSGTSLSAPIFAAMQAEVDQATHRRHGSINPTLYADYYLFGSSAGKTGPFQIFHDVTTGNNGEPAGKGWDPVTGLGVPDGETLAAIESF